MINLGVGACQIELTPAGRGQEAADKPKSAGNQTDLSSPSKRELKNILTAGLSGHQNFLISEMRRGRFIGDKGQLEVVDDPVHHGIVGPVLSSKLAMQRASSIWISSLQVRSLCLSIKLFQPELKNGFNSTIIPLVSVGIILYEAFKQRKAKGFYEKRRLSPEEFEIFLKRWLNKHSEM